MMKSFAATVLLFVCYQPISPAQAEKLEPQQVAVGDVTRFVAVGDLEPTQHVDAAIANWEKHEKIKFDFGLILGDNFYEEGVHSADDPRWKSEWEDLYGELNMSFFAVLGNHDYKGNTQAQVDYTKKSPSHSWKMPTRYYPIAAGPVELFAMDTCTIAKNTCRGVHPDPRQLQALTQWLAQSTARWKIVFGHHPIFSGGEHGVSGDLKPLYDALAPELKGKVDFYLAGHDHDLELIREPNTNLLIAISGSGGHNLRTVTKVEGSRYCTQNKPGFATLEISQKTLRFAFVSEGKELFSCTLRKDPSETVDPESCLRKVGRCPD